MHLTWNVDAGDIVSSILALIAIWISYIVFRSQVDPEVVVYATEDNERPSFINLVIENIGRGSAHDVDFEADRQFPMDAWGITGPIGVPGKFDKGAFVHGIPVMHPSERRVYAWGQYGGLLRALENRPITVEVTYKAGRDFLRPWARRSIMLQSVIDVRSLEHVDVAESWGSRLVKETKKLRMAVERLKRSDNG
jgi:hypothetical protein